MKNLTMKNLVVTWASVPDRDYLVAEIWQGNIQLAEASLVNENPVDMKIEFFARKGDNASVFYLEELVLLLNEIRDELAQIRDTVSNN